MSREANLGEALAASRKHMPAVMRSAQLAVAMDAAAEELLLAVERDAEPRYLTLIQTWRAAVNAYYAARGFPRGVGNLKDPQ